MKVRRDSLIPLLLLVLFTAIAGANAAEFTRADAADFAATKAKADQGDANAQFILAPLTILDYIIVHELAHLIHANHTEAFWNEVDKVLPDYLDRKQWLRVNGAGMSP